VPAVEPSMAHANPALGGDAINGSSRPIGYEGSILNGTLSITVTPLTQS